MNEYRGLYDEKSKIGSKGLENKEWLEVKEAGLEEPQTVNDEKCEKG